MGSSVGGIKIMVNALLDVQLFQSGLIRYDLIMHSIMLLVNAPETRCYLRHFKDLNRILHVFTQPDGTDKDPPKIAIDKL